MGVLECQGMGVHALKSRLLWLLLVWTPDFLSLSLSLSLSLES